MAVTKEAMVIIIDIGKNSLQKDPETDETFFDKEKLCWTKILQRKIFSAKKDEVGVILMGTHETDNELHRSMEGYEHLREALPLEIPTWAMMRNLENHVQHEGADADWLDALILAMDLLRRETVAKKFGNFKIVLFSTFSTYVNDDNVSFVIQGLKKLDIELVVIGHNVEVAELSDDGPSQGVFTQKDNKSEHQRLSEELVKRIIEESNGYLCNFDYALNHLINFQRRKAKPWYWNSTLDIGSKIKIQIAATISTKEENHFKWETESAAEGTSSWTAIEYFNNGEKVEPATEDLIKGYMLGSTPLPYDESLGITANPTQKGLRCLLFTKKSNLLEEHLGGNGSYLILPKKGQIASAKMLVALIKAMEKSEMIMIGSRVYANGNKPKLVALIPNNEREYPCLSMFELFYAEQYFYWNFPLLRTRKTEPSAEQYSAIDKLIDSMDLMNVDDDTNHPKEAFPHRHLVNLSLQHIYETITKRALQPQRPVPTLDGRLLETVQVPSKIKTASTNVIKEIKELFPLEEVQKVGKRELIRKIGDIPAESNDNAEAAPSNNAPAEAWTLVEVGTVTPAEDFLLLIERGEEFSVLSKQIKNIITDLIFKSMTEQNEKIAKAIMAFREEAKFYAPWDYTEWIKELKNSIIAGKKIDFWQNVVVKDGLGIIPISESDLVTSISDEEAAEFYKISTRTEATGNTDAGESVDDMFDNM